VKRNFDEKSEKFYQVKDSIKRLIDFKVLNLLDDYTALGKFDVVFCRNVLIYFSAELKRDILRRIHRVLVPGGYLFLGSSESLGSNMDLYDMQRYRPGIVYRAR